MLDSDKYQEDFRDYRRSKQEKKAIRKAARKEAKEARENDWEFSDHLSSNATPDESVGTLVTTHTKDIATRSSGRTSSGCNDG